MIKDILLPEKMTRLSELTIALHLAFMERACDRMVKFNRPEGATEDQFPAKVVAQLTAFLSTKNHEDDVYRLQRGSDLTEVLFNKDQNERDPLFRNIHNMLSMYAENSIDTARQTAAQKMLKVEKKYEIDTRENLETEGLKISQWLQEQFASAELTAAAATLGLTEALQQLDTINTECRQLAGDRNDERALQETSALKNARTATDVEYEWMIRMLAAAALMDNNETRYLTLIRGLNEDINYYKKTILGKPSSADTGAGTNQNENGSGNENENENQGGSGNENQNQNENPGTGGGGTTPDPDPNAGGTEN
ncbi:MAG: hypothetical protein IJ897_04980 [Prevotella sp.]|nr:hypothetical protein [Prevotella sp.]